MRNTSWLTQTWMRLSNGVSTRRPMMTRLIAARTLGWLARIGGQVDCKAFKRTSLPTTVDCERSVGFWPGQSHYLSICQNNILKRRSLTQDALPSSPTTHRKSADQRVAVSMRTQTRNVRTRHFGRQPSKQSPFTMLISYKSLQFWRQEMCPHLRSSIRLASGSRRHREPVHSWSMLETCCKHTVTIDMCRHGTAWWIIRDRSAMQFRSSFRRTMKLSLDLFQRLSRKIMSPNSLRYQLARCTMKTWLFFIESRLLYQNSQSTLRVL